MRNKAQLELSSMHSYTRPTQIKNRCIMGGVAKGVLRAFRMGRVSWLLSLPEKSRAHFLPIQHNHQPLADRESTNADVFLSLS